MRKSDFLWFLAYPIYQVLGTIRHELSHAAMALLQGARITEVQVLPSMLGGRFYWGYVRYTGGHPDWLTAAAPYFCDLVTFALVWALFPRFDSLPRWVRMNVFILGMLSPLLNMAFNYRKGIMSGLGDVSRILVELPPVPVHLVFILAMAGMCGAIWMLKGRSAVRR